ncbi:hypothetical protein PPL_01128 [Heterostelium album PN500]|uniref:Transglutaminase-like domain-containing protein n=1 Tax=Heterostelium pallidum (strain ATCC 26659 / Pp 5 / PN500) TaxID=670386 RepID=D3AY69_HETP5|nr:hypothetical protein PPL_01128 [Heterostelium album PN500]EFA85896.1 hypothetical protein PPL_01128 [Heterostelium album PN500]|eukprot:XP_020438002.1 hypothetical protein PPL_01128 [Heterostelium album PN500]
MSTPNSNVWMEECSRIYLHKDNVLQPAFRENHTGNLCTGQFGGQQQHECLFQPRIDIDQIAPGAKTALIARLTTVRGRCGEWANTFTLFCRALGYRARYILDMTDHVWTEIWSDSENRWIHCDSCEPAYDKPLTYESGWGKKLTYVFAFEVDGIFDVSRRYTTQINQMLQRRGMVEEDWLRIYLEQLNQRMRAAYAPERKEHLIKREQAEKKELENSQNRSVSNDLLPRQSGSDDWKSQRGETGLGLTNSSKRLHVQKSVERASPPTISTVLYNYELLTRSKLNLIGNCKILSDRIELTPRQNDQVGAFWVKDKLKVTDGFVVRIKFINEMGGADGMAFVLHNHSADVIGKRGSGLGYDGIENSLAVEFDSYSSVDSCADPNGNHISIHCNGERKNSSHHQHSLAHAMPVDNVPINDGRIHHAAITYNANSKTMSVWYDSFNILTDVSVDLDTLLDLPNGEAWIGMTASTGGLCQSHHILSFEFGLL